METRLHRAVQAARWGRAFFSKNSSESARKQKNSQIVDIRAGGAGHNQPADFCKGGIGVVLPKNVAGVDPCCPQGGKAVLIDVTARRVRWAVGAVGAKRKRGGLRKTGDALCRGKRKLLIRPWPVRWTTVSPPARNASGRAVSACVFAMLARKRPASRASQFRQSVRRIHE